MLLIPLRRAASPFDLVASLVLLAPSMAVAQSADTGTVVSSTGMVVSVHHAGSDAGARILRAGGNAVDAAVATGFALAVVNPSAGNIGGGGFMIVRPVRGAPIAIDYRERAPLAATPTMYLDSAGNIDGRRTATGYLAPGVPGTVRGLSLAHRRFGKLKWRDVVMPAVELAEQGFVLSASLARSINGEIARGMAPYPASVRAYGKPGGGEWQAGDTLRLPDLGRSLRAIAEQGPDAFYKGWIADSIAASMRANGGLITKRDLAAYEAKVRTPVRGTFKGYEIISMPPPSSGGIALIEALNILEAYDLGSFGRSSVQANHLTLEAMRRAFLDRARHLGDPDFVKIPVDRLLSKAHAREVASTISPTRASSSIALGRDIITQLAADTESDETTHFSVVDRDGMAVSNTYTLEGGYGSHVVVSGAGFILNNEMGDFNKKPGWTDTLGNIGTPANVIAPGKRMLSSMTPVIVTKDGQLVLVTGSPGGRTIINTSLNVVLAVTEYGMSIRDAVDAPRMHHQWLPDRATFEQHMWGEGDSTVIEGLREMGHVLRVGGGQGDAHSIFWDARSRTAHGAADRRSADSRASRP